MYLAHLSVPLPAGDITHTGRLYSRMNREAALIFLFGLEALLTRVSRAHLSAVPSLSQPLVCYWLVQRSVQFPTFFSLYCVGLGKYWFVEASETRGTTALVYCLINSSLRIYRYCTRVVEYLLSSSYIFCTNRQNQTTLDDDIWHFLVISTKQYCSIESRLRALDSPHCPSPESYPSPCPTPRCGPNPETGLRCTLLIVLCKGAF
jgi:hypothetical protein